MKKTADKYNMTRPSVSGKPGFELLGNEDEKTCYFLFNDAEGTPVLFSETYSTPESRMVGLRSVLANAGDAKSFKIKKDENGFFVSLKAKNHREIARSRHFTRKQDLEDVMQRLQEEIPKAQQDFGAVPVPAKPTPPVKKPTPERKLSKEVQKVLGSLPAQKYAFRIDLYPRKEDQTLHGRIYSAIDEDSLNFSGLDMNAIRRFLMDHIPEEWVRPREAADHPGTNEDGLALTTKKQEKPHQPVHEKTGTTNFIQGEEHLKIRLLDEKGLPAASSLPVNAPLSCQISLSETVCQKLPAGVKIPVEFSLKSIPENRLIPLGTFQFEVNGSNRKQVPFAFYIPYPGVFRLIAHSSKSGNTELEGSVLLAGTG